MMLQSLLKQMIRLNGPMSVHTYWNICLTHPQFGYYTTRDPLGTAGDFTTAPEISQLFGEMIGVWVAEEWIRLGRPRKLYLAECGPGRGTLMHDVLRIADIVPDLPQAVSVHLVEISPALCDKQRKTLQSKTLRGCDVSWHDNLNDAPCDAPMIIWGNEFLDALPVAQYVMQDGAWHERVIGLDGNEHLAWGIAPASVTLDVQGAYDGCIAELSPAREEFFAQVCERIIGQGGGALMIDYGHVVSGFADTFQAVKHHRFCNVLEHCGEADLTSHVDFARLQEIAQQKNIMTHLQTQHDFLIRIGIKQRAAQLKRTAGDSVQLDLQAGLHRLIDDHQMGSLFKVIEVRQ